MMAHLCLDFVSPVVPSWPGDLSIWHGVLSALAQNFGPKASVIFFPISLSERLLSA